MDANPFLEKQPGRARDPSRHFGQIRRRSTLCWRMGVVRCICSPIEAPIRITNTNYRWARIRTNNDQSPTDVRSFLFALCWRERKRAQRAEPTTHLAIAALDVPDTQNSAGRRSRYFIGVLSARRLSHKPFVSYSTSRTLFLPSVIPSFVSASPQVQVEGYRLQLQSAEGPHSFRSTKCMYVL